LGAETLVRFLHRLNNDSIQKQLPSPPAPEPEPLTWQYFTTPRKTREKVRLSLRRIAKKAFIQGSVLARRPKHARGNLILAYHLVLKEDRRTFEDHLKFFNDHFKVGSLRNLLQATASDDRDEFRLAITFDDGFKILMQDCLELLEKHQVKAGFFVPAAFIGSKLHDGSPDEFNARSFYYSHPLEPMSPGDLKRLAALGHEVGSHGFFHTNIHSMTPEAIDRELTLSRALISDWTGVAPDGYAYPYGRTSNAQGNPADWLRSIGFAYGLTLTRGAVDASTNPFALPRHHAEGNWPIREMRYFLFT
jgi:peptidoglycan/xylan/chitin deacetylase (PgdA/CDA1 family)